MHQLASEYSLSVFTANVTCIPANQTFIVQILTVYECESYPQGERLNYCFDKPVGK